MSQQTILLGTVANDGTGTPLRTGGDMINDNFTELYTQFLPATDLAAGTALAVRKAYFDTVSANRTFDALPAGADGDRISLTFDVTGATRTLNFHTNSTVYRGGESGALAAAISFLVGNHELSLRKADGKWWLLDTGFVPPKIVTKHSAAAYTVGTTDPNEVYGGQLLVTSTGTQSLPAITEGASLTVIADAAVVVTIDPNGAEVIRLNGVDLAAGFAIKSSGAIGEMVVLTYHGAGKWYAATSEFITNGS